MSGYDPLQFLHRAELVNLSVQKLSTEAHRLQTEAERPETSIERQLEILERLRAIVAESDVLSQSIVAIREEQLVAEITRGRHTVLSPPRLGLKTRLMARFRRAR